MLSLQCSNSCIHTIHILAIWSSPAVKGTRPPPCSHFSFTSINDHEAIMYGGRLASGRSVNDIYLFDFSEMVSHKQIARVSDQLSAEINNRMLFLALRRRCHHDCTPQL